LANTWLDDDNSSNNDDDDRNNKQGALSLRTTKDAQILV
jgi:hypothetical protein